MKIVILGSKGFLGTKAKEILSKNHEIIEGGRSNETEFQVDATKKEEVRKFLLKHKPEVVLDTIALTSSVQCENNPELAEQLNYLTAKNISEVCREIGAWMIFISSSYLFDGEKGNYNEEDETMPINEYARTKIMAEEEVLKNPKSVILRVDIMYGYNGKDKKNGVFGMILSGNPINLRQPNQLRQPIFIDDVLRIMIELIKKNQQGIFHLAGPNRIKMIDFLKSLESIFREKSLVSVETKPQENILKMPKIPSNATFDTSKIQKLGAFFTDFDSGLKIMEKDLGKF